MSRERIIEGDKLIGELQPYNEGCGYVEGVNTPYGGQKGLPCQGGFINVGMATGLDGLRYDYKICPMCHPDNDLKPEELKIIKRRRANEKV